MSRGTTVEEVHQAILELQAQLQATWSAEKEPADSALRKLDWRHCADKKRFKREVGRLEQDLKRALSDLLDIYLIHFDPKKRVVDNLMDNHHQEWFGVMTDVESLKKDISERLMHLEWQSVAGVTYQQVLPAQLAALEELYGVAVANYEATEQVAVLNASIYQVTRESIDVVRETIKDDTQPDDYADRDTDWFGFGSGELKGYYYTAAWNAVAHITQLNTWIRAVVDGSEWGQTAVDLGDAIKTVETSPANLKPNGGWPRAIAQQANVSTLEALGSHQGQVSTASTSSQDKGVKLR